MWEESLRNASGARMDGTGWIGGDASCRPMPVFLKKAPRLRNVTYGKAPLIAVCGVAGASTWRQAVSFRKNTEGEGSSGFPEQRLGFVDFLV